MCKETPYIAEIGPLDGFAPLTVYPLYSDDRYPDQLCALIDDQLRPLCELQGKYSIIVSLRPDAAQAAPKDHT